MDHCVRCGVEPVAGDGRKLCEVCDSAVVRSLSMFAPIVADLRSMMVGLQSTAYDEVRVDTSRTDYSLRLDMDLSDRAHDLYAIVADWCVSWIPCVPGSVGPAHLREWDTRKHVLRLPSGFSAFSAAAATSSWLIANHDEIATYDEAGTYANDVIDGIANEARAVGYKPRVRQVNDKLCRRCDGQTLRLHLPLDGLPVLRCTACGGEYPCGPVTTRAILQSR